MTKDWRKVKEEIEADLDRIWWEEPEEVTMSKLGIFPSGASVDGQVLGNIFFLVADTQSMGWGCVEPGMSQAMKDSTLTVEHLKNIWKYLTVSNADLLGAVDPPGCPAPWLNLPKVKGFASDIVESFDSIKTKEELEDLLWSWFAYINCLNRWFFLVFPLHLGKEFPLITRERAETISKLSKTALIVKK